jgi:hypothetical protein
MWHKAGTKCDETTVRLLLEKDADVDTQAGGYGPELQTASLQPTPSDRSKYCLRNAMADINALGGRIGSGVRV